MNDRLCPYIQYMDGLVSCGCDGSALGMNGFTLTLNYPTTSMMMCYL